MSDSKVLPAVRQFILDRFLQGEDPSRLTMTTPLISGGIVDSLGTLELVSFLEQQLGVEFEAHEVDRQNLDTLASIDAFVQRKTSRGQ
jgi:acyl carrier protein